MKRLAIIGHLGNMGRRYAAVCDHLGIDWIGIDELDSPKRVEAFKAEGIILATPTKLHLQHLKSYSEYGLPILVEKPVVKTRKELDEVLALKVPVRVVNQYAYFYDAASCFGESMVDYYNTGNDGLVWDCINLIGLARRDILLRNKSPIWTIKLNGIYLDRRLVDKSYCDMVWDWSQAPTDDKNYIFYSHNKVMKYEENKSSHRDPGQEIIIAPT